jgi:hypothetical protein
LGIIAFIILGLLAGAIAKALMPGDDPGGGSMILLRDPPHHRQSAGWHSAHLTICG